MAIKLHNNSLHISAGIMGIAETSLNGSLSCNFTIF